MRLIAKVRQETGTTLPLRALFEFATPASLALQLSGTNKDGYNPLIPLRKNGASSPIFCVHGGGGIGSVYSNFSRAINADYPVYGIQARGLEEGEEMHLTLDDMVESYIQAIQSIQPKGPYRLVGWSLGGTIAHEIACALEAKNEVVELLALLDTRTSYEANEEGQPLSIDEAISKIAKDYGVEFSKLDYEENKHLELIRDLLVKQDLIPSETPLEWVKRAFSQLLAAPSLTKNHQTKIISSPILYFEASKEVGNRNRAHYDWQKHTRSAVISHSVDSLHNTMMRPESISIVTKVIENYLATLHLNEETDAVDHQSN
jgi:thioesterase domain-containing protein